MSLSLKWGIIGPGEIAHQFCHDLQLIRTPQKIQALLGHSEEGIEKFSAAFKPEQVFQELDDFLENADVDIVYIATPHTFHFEHSMACLKKGIPVLCEKPVTLSLQQCEELVETARAKKVFFMEAMWIRFLPSIKLLLSLLEQGRIGKIISVKASIGFRAPHDLSNRFFDPSLGGGSLPDLGIYPIFLSYLLLGKPDTLKAIGTLSETGIDETCSVLLQYPHGEHAIMESSIISESTLPAEICGDKGVIRILHPWFEKSAGIELDIFNDGKIIYPCSWEGHGLQFEAEEAISCISNNKIESEILSHEFSLGMQRIMDEILQQIQVEYPLEEH